MAIYAKEIDMNDRKAMVTFLTEHFRYPTMNSWNRSTSYANNVKIYNLEIPKELDDLAWRVVCDSELDTFDLESEISWLIEAFHEQTGYDAGFNGRSSGYLVLYDTEWRDGKSVTMPGRPIDMYEEFDDEEEWDIDRLRERCELVCAFDRLCDDIRDAFVYRLQHGHIETETYLVEKTHSRLVLDED